MRWRSSEAALDAIADQPRFRRPPDTRRSSSTARPQTDAVRAALVRLLPRTAIQHDLTRLRSFTRPGWYQDALDEARLTTSEAVILTGGIKAWVGKFGEGEDAVVRL